MLHLPTENFSFLAIRSGLQGDTKVISNSVCSIIDHTKWQGYLIRRGVVDGLTSSSRWEFLFMDQGDMHGSGSKSETPVQTLCAHGHYPLRTQNLGNSEERITQSTASAVMRDGVGSRYHALPLNCSYQACTTLKSSHQEGPKLVQPLKYSVPAKKPSAQSLIAVGFRSPGIAGVLL